MCYVEILGNSIFRFEQEDGNLALPFKTDKGYHLGGEVRIIGKEGLGKLLDGLKKILDKVKSDLKVVVPPVPRYVFGGCCEKPGHATNVRSEGYAEKVVSEVQGVRKELKEGLLKRGIDKTWVSGCLDFLDKETKEDQKSRVDSMRQLFQKDNVHLTVKGYANWADRLWEEGQDRHRTLTRQRLQSNRGTGVQRKYFWRGFMSENGTVRNHQKPVFAGRGRGRKYHPYAKK